MKPDLRMMVAGVGLLLFGLLVGRFAFGGEAAAKRELGIAAKIDDQVVTLEEVERALAPQLARLQEQKHQLMESKLEELIAERLHAQEAKRRGMTVEELLKAEVSSKVPEVTETEVTSFITENKARLRGETAELRPQVRNYLRDQKVAQQQRAYVAGLRQNAKVVLFLQEPEPIRVAVKAEGAFAKGPKDAPVTLVEFTDFHCPFCGKAVATLKDVMREYDGKIRWVFRDFPIASLHPQAPKAAEAARCAGERGKFWEYHDLLFESQSQTAAADFRRFAEQLKLDLKSFGQCLDSGKYQAAVEADIQDGARLGITGTPTFFINGRILVGAQPVESFRKIIEAELRYKPK
ncbi:MAG: thioredoxin domain-containing protein [Candidatus Methylomirabilis sp.]